MATTISAQSLTERQKHLATIATLESNEWLEQVTDEQYEEANN